MKIVLTPKIAHALAIIETFLDLSSFVDSSLRHESGIAIERFKNFYALGIGNFCFPIFAKFAIFSADIFSNCFVDVLMTDILMWSVPSF